MILTLLKWINGGGNFEKTTHGKVGDIIYPANNETNGWFKKERWDLVTKVSSKGYILNKSYIWDYATVRTIELMRKLDAISREDGQ